MKSLVAGLVVLSLTAISCKQNDKSNQTNQSEIQSKSPKEEGTAGSNNNISQAMGLSAIASGPTGIKLTWNSVPNATSYWIYRDTYVPAIVPQTNYTDKAVKAGTTYTYAVAPVINGTLGAKSVSVTVTTPR